MIDESLLVPSTVAGSAKPGGFDLFELRLAGADYEHIFAAGGGILSSVRQTQDRDDETLYRESLARLDRMRRMGTTAVEIKSGYGLDLTTELRQLRVARLLSERTGTRVRTTCLAAHAVPADLRGSPAGRAEFVARVCTEILPAVAAAGLADYCDVFCDRGAFTPDETRAVLRAARDLGLELRVHANEFGHTGGARLAAELHARSADHLLALDDDERAALRDAGVVATLLPGTSLVLGKPFADGRALVRAGVPVAVATDCNPGSCALENLAMVLALACYGCKLSPAEAIVAVTHNAACSLDLADQVGRIAPGMSADLLILATPDYRDLVYHAGSPLISAVFQRGAVDGLSVVVPYGEADYYRSRPGIAVPRPGEAAAVAALADLSFVARSVSHFAAGRTRLASALNELGRRTLPSAANFVSVSFADAAVSAADVCEALAKSGILVRHLRNYGMPDWLRITVGTDEEVDRILRKLKLVLQDQTVEPSANCTE